MKHHKDWFLFRVKVLSWLFLPILRVVCCALYLYAPFLNNSLELIILSLLLLVEFLKLNCICGLIFCIVFVLFCFLICDSYRLQLIDSIYIYFYVKISVLGKSSPFQLLVIISGKRIPWFFEYFLGFVITLRFSPFFLFYKACVSSPSSGHIYCSDLMDRY